MPDEAGRDAAFYDHENESRRHVADWGGDELFTRMPGRREVHAGPPPRFRRPAPIDPLHRAPGEATGRFRRDPDRLDPVADEPFSAATDTWGIEDDDSLGSHQTSVSREIVSSDTRAERSPAIDVRDGRRTVVISGRPDGVARPSGHRRRPPRTVAERVGARPERIVAWAFVLGLLLILIAVATADAALR
jgi:hypothetical protein